MCGAGCAEGVPFLASLTPEDDVAADDEDEGDEETGCEVVESLRESESEREREDGTSEEEGSKEKEREGEGEE